jgi:hypothetical protein
MSPGLKKILIFAAAGLGLYLLIGSPVQSADWVKDFIGWLKWVAERVIFFVNSLFD